MNRREFMAAIGSVAVSPLAAHAQEAGRIYRLGVLIPATRASVEPFFDELRINGFVEGQNMVVTGAYSVRAEQIAESTAALMQTQPEVILCGPEAYLRVLQTATRTIPLDSMSEDLVGEGFVASLAKPGGNITGISLLSPELDGKRLEILTEAVPGLRRVAALAHSIVTKEHLAEQQELARSRGVELSVLAFASASEIAPALDAAKASGAQAINLSGEPAPGRQPRHHPLDRHWTRSRRRSACRRSTSGAETAGSRRPDGLAVRHVAQMYSSASHGRSPRCCGAPNPPRCRWSSRRISSSSRQPQDGESHRPRDSGGSGDAVSEPTVIECKRPRNSKTPRGCPRDVLSQSWLRRKISSRRAD